MARRYSVTFDLAVNTSASTNTYPFQLVTGANSIAEVYEFIVGCDPVTQVDNAVVAGLGFVSAATAGSALTPSLIDQLESTANTTASSQPTAVTLAPALPAAALIFAFNARVTMRWAAVDPDSRVRIKGNSGANAGLVCFNQQPGTATITARNYAAFAE